MQLPDFKYHPDPLSTGSIKASPAACDCCGHARGFAYAASFYSAQVDSPTLCPWCIASGEAAKKYDGMFSDDYPLRAAGVAEDIIREVCARTPGYNSWQQEVWQCHCNDACAFHGDADPAELRALSKEEMTDLLHQNTMREDQWCAFIDGYRKGGNPAVYKFVCCHCRKPTYYLDFT